ncbi:hypothetical protein BDN72DRAFT_832533 [Pluteus cervinus]|uniref:Uncharacterized protein n=1 Tax=Pluteus cervinus TaxID=181527 RepID=A0ACD3BAS1_9AGAR|nr:hypothetical protein BDN72DRAFT_832533 [Pluteus cervinus]
MVIITTLILCPIDVVITRLVLQRNYGGSRFKKFPQFRWPRRTVREPATMENTIPTTHQVGEKDIEMAVDEGEEVDIGTLRTPTTTTPIILSHPQSRKRPATEGPSTSERARQETSEDEEDAEDLQGPYERSRFNPLCEPYTGFLDCIRSIVREGVNAWRCIVRGG